MNRVIVRVVLLSMIPSSFTFAAGDFYQEFKICTEISRDLQRLSCFDKLETNKSLVNSTILDSTVLDTTAIETTTNTIVATTASEEKDVRSNNTDTVNSSLANDSKSNNQSASSIKRYGMLEPLGGLDELKNSIAGEFIGWKNGTKLKLANGQIWKVINFHTNFYHKAMKPNITITKGTFDSFRIKVDGLNKSANVIRIK